MEIQEVATLDDVAGEGDFRNWIDGSCGVLLDDMIAPLHPQQSLACHWLADGISRIVFNQTQS